MKTIKILLVLLICLTLGCSTEDVKPLGHPGSGSGGGGYTVASQAVTLSTLQMSTANILSVIRNNPSSLIITEGGIQYWKLINPNVSPLFNYAREIRLLKSDYIPPATTPTGWDQLRAQFVTDLNRLSVSSQFKSNLLSAFDYVRTLNGKTFAEFETYFENKLYSIANPSPFGTKLTVNENFALTQSYYALLTQVKWVYQNPSASSSGSGPCNLTKEEWKEVAESSFVAGMTGGLSVGWNWAVAGGIATGGHPAGAVVGGIIGFATGFIGGTVAGGGIKMMWECIENKLFDIRMKYMCGSKTFYAPASHPPVSGCVQIAPTASVLSIKNYAFVPNKGRTVLATQTITDINWFLSYF